MDSTDKPSFMQVLLRDFDTKLELPWACAEILESVPSKVTIRTQYGSWTVKVKKKLNEPGDSFSFYLKGNGWVDLVKHNGLRKGDFLVFSLSSHSEFHLLVFGKTSCLKKLKRGNKPKNTRDKALVRFTQFEVELRRFNLFGLTVPADFVARTGLQRMKKVMVKDCEGREFSVKVEPRSYGEVMLGLGWDKFAEQNGLEPGMTCIIQSAIKDDDDDADDPVLLVGTVEKV